MRICTLLFLFIFSSCIKLKKKETQEVLPPPKSSVEEPEEQLRFDQLEINDVKVFNPQIKFRGSFVLDQSLFRYFPLKVSVYIKVNSNLKLIYNTVSGPQGKVELNVDLPQNVDRFYFKFRADGKNYTQVYLLKKVTSIEIGILENLFNLIIPSAHAQDFTSSSYYPAKCNLGTLAFEDLWPSKGDFDFNDLVVNYNFEHYIDSNGHLKKLKAHFIFRATGADFQNGFALRLPIARDKVISVTGNYVNDWFYKIEDNGVEQGHEDTVVIIAGNINKLLPKWANVYHDQTRVSPFEINVEIDFKDGVVFENETRKCTCQVFLQLL